jgi:hypothetical protein
MRFFRLQLLENSDLLTMSDRNVITVRFRYLGPRFAVKLGIRTAGMDFRRGVEEVRSDG